MSIPFPMDAIADGLSHGHTCAMPQIAQAELNTAAREAYPAGDSTFFWIWDFSKIVWSFPDFVFLFRFGEIFCGFQHSWWGFPHKSVNHCCVAYDSSAIRSAPRLLQNISKTPRNEIKMTKKMTKCEAKWRKAKHSQHDRALGEAALKLTSCCKQGNEHVMICAQAREKVVMWRKKW